jgi:ferredoxin
MHFNQLCASAMNGAAQTSHSTMPDINDRLPQNIPGLFYVDSSCIDCDVCRNTAPEFFRRDDDIGFSVVYRQPATKAETDLCVEAMFGCPTESIGRTEQA